MSGETPTETQRTTPLAVRVLQQLLDANGWTQDDIAEKADIHRSTVSMHLSRQRPIRDKDIVNYLRPLARRDRQMLLAAWLRDVLSAEVSEDILDSGANRVNEHVLAWSPQLDPGDRQMLSWVATQLPRDSDLAQLFRTVCARSGFKPAPER